MENNNIKNYNIDDIKKVVNSIRIAKDDNKFAIDFKKTIQKIEKEYNFTINIKENNQEDLDLEDLKHFSKFSGSVEKKSDKEFIIKINPFDYPLRQNFTKAHELGHIILKHEFPSDTNIITDTTENIIGRPGATFEKNKPEEIEANNFAAEFLMPESLIKEKFPDIIIQSLDDVEKIAKDDFEVSKAAMMVRLNSLNYQF